MPKENFAYSYLTENNSIKGIIQYKDIVQKWLDEGVTSDCLGIFGTSPERLSGYLQDKVITMPGEDGIPFDYNFPKIKGLKNVLVELMDNYNAVSSCAEVLSSEYAEIIKKIARKDSESPDEYLHNFNRPIEEVCRKNMGGKWESSDHYSEHFLGYNIFSLEIAEKNAEYRKKGYGSVYDFLVSHDHEDADIHTLKESVLGKGISKEDFMQHYETAKSLRGIIIGLDCSVKHDFEDRIALGECLEGCFIDVKELPIKYIKGIKLGGPKEIKLFEELGFRPHTDILAK